jgi:hypothetical protein
MPLLVVSGVEGLRASIELPGHAEADGAVPALGRDHCTLEALREHWGAT